MKRTLSLRATQSPYSAKVTLYEPADAAEYVRRSKRLKGSTDIPDHAQPEVSGPHRKETKRVSSAATLVKTEDVSTTSVDALAEKFKPKRVTSPRKPKSIPTALKTPHPAPPRWQETYDTIKRMRSRIVAPVDTMGCDRAQLKEADPRVRCSCWSVDYHLTLLPHGRTSVFRRSFRLCCHHRPRTRSQTLPWPSCARPSAEPCP